MIGISSSTENTRAEGAIGVEKVGQVVEQIDLELNFFFSYLANVLINSVMIDLLGRVNVEKGGLIFLGDDGKIYLLQMEGKKELPEEGESIAASETTPLDSPAGEGVQRIEVLEDESSPLSAEAAPPSSAVGEVD